MCFFYKISKIKYRIYVACILISGLILYYLLFTNVFIVYSYIEGAYETLSVIRSHSYFRYRLERNVNVRVR